MNSSSSGAPWPEHSAGAVMSREVVAFPKGDRVRDAVATLKSLATSAHPPGYAYAVDEAGRLVGVLNMRDLLLADDDAPLASVMRGEVFSVPARMDREEMLRALGARHFLAVPVVDDAGRLVGAVRADEVLRSAQEEATEDIQRLFGAGAEEKALSPAAFKVRRRLPWLVVNLSTAFLAASVVGLFEDLIGRVAALAVFLPIVAGQGGNAGVQALSVVLRGLAVGEVDLSHAARLAGLELLVGLANGLAVGAVTAVAAWLWHGNPWMGVVIGLAMIINMLAAGLSGAAIPLLMKRLGFDPAQSSGIFLTTVTDIVGFFAFLGFAWAFQGRLVP